MRKITAIYYATAVTPPLIGWQVRIPSRRWQREAEPDATRRANTSCDQLTRCPATSVIGQAGVMRLRRIQRNPLDANQRLTVERHQRSCADESYDRTSYCMLIAFTAEAVAGLIEVTYECRKPW
jgi:hypothetical protein